MQIAIIYYDPADYERWFNAIDTEDSKFAYYQVFSKKGRLFKRYHQITTELLGGSDSKSIKDHRIEDYEFQSIAVHGGSLPVNIGAWSFNDDEVKPALFGSVCESLNNISCSIAVELHNFIRLLSALLSQVHQWQQTDAHELISNFEFYRFSSEKEFEKYLEENYVIVKQT